MQLAFEYCDKAPISWFNRLFVSLEEIRIGAFKSGYQAGYDEAKKYWAITPKYELDSKLKELLDQEFKPGPWAHLFEKK